MDTLLPRQIECAMSQKPAISYTDTHTARNTHKKAYFVGYQRRGEAYQALRYDSWLAAFRRWWELRRHPAYSKVRMYRS